MRDILGKAGAIERLHAVEKHYNILQAKALADAKEEIARLRGLLREYADVVRLIKAGRPVPLDFLEIRIQHALGDDPVRQSNNPPT